MAPAPARPRGGAEDLGDLAGEVAWRESVPRAVAGDLPGDAHVAAAGGDGTDRQLPALQAARARYDGARAE